MASAAERTWYSWNPMPRRNADATVSFLLISAAVGCCAGGALWALLSSSGFVWSGRCDCAGGNGCEDWASADLSAKEQTTSTTMARASGERYAASRRLGRIGSLLRAEFSTDARGSPSKTVDPHLHRDRILIRPVAPRKRGPV